MKKKNYLNLLMLFLVITLMCCLGCGRKYWPSPVVEEEVFKFTKVESIIENNCILISGEIVGNVKNLKDIFLEMELTRDSCPSCPFTPDKKVLITRDYPSLTIRDNYFKFNYCLESKNKIGRVRLLGINRFSQLGPVYSEVVKTKIQKGEL